MNAVTGGLAAGTNATSTTVDVDEFDLPPDATTDGRLDTGMPDPAGRLPGSTSAHIRARLSTERPDRRSAPRSHARADFGGLAPSPRGLTPVHAKHSH